jgi:hypothetical protein
MHPKMLLHVKLCLKFNREYRRTRVTFCTDAKKTVSETYELMQIMLGNATMGRARNFEWFPSFERERYLVRNNSRVINGKITERVRIYRGLY